jgi:hypothetical protein
MIVVVVMTAPRSFSKMLVELPGLSKHERHRAPKWRSLRPEKKRAGQQSAFTAPPGQYAALLDLGAATLDQNDQHNYDQHSAYDLNDGGTVHVQFSFPQ